MYLPGCGGPFIWCCEGKGRGCCGFPTPGFCCGAGVPITGFIPGLVSEAVPELEDEGDLDPLL